MRTRIPLFSSLGGYRSQWLRGDVVAGLTVWAVLVPEALAYATIAGVSPVVGLYAAPAALIFYAAFGSSRHLVTGPMAATAALSAAAIGNLASQGSSQFVALTVTLAITTGVIALLAGLLRLGFLANFISEPVLKGFIVGLALTIIVGQLPKLFGISKGEGDFFEQLWHVLTHLGQTSGLTLLVGLVSLALVLVLRRVALLVPGSLVAVLFGIVVVWAFGLDKHGVKIVGTISSGLPSLGLPDVAAADYLRVEGGLFFANAEAVSRSVKEHATEKGIKVVVLDAETVPFVDVSAARMLGRLADDLARQDVQLVMARNVGQVRDVLRRAQADAETGTPPIGVYPTIQAAVDALTAQPEGSHSS